MKESRWSGSRKTGWGVEEGEEGEAEEREREKSERERERVAESRENNTPGRNGDSQVPA